MAKKSEWSPWTRLCLFDLGRASTTRTIALTVVREQGGGLARRGAATRRQRRYQEVTCRSALNAVKGMPFHWTLNPYRGCTHACHYCFARRYQTQFELGPDDEFSSIIFVKINFPEILRRELEKPSWKRELVALGTATDPYQPIEGHYKLTRRALEALIAARTPVGLVTKGPMVVRDADLLAELAQRRHCTVAMSVPTVDEGAWARTRAGDCSPAAAPARGSRARRSGSQRRRADGARPGLHDRTITPRSDDPSRRRTRCGVHGRQRPT